jgi:hypothetical protein
VRGVRVGAGLCALRACGAGKVGVRGRRGVLNVIALITAITVTECHIQEQITRRTARGSIHALPFRSLREVECGGGQRGVNLDIRVRGEPVIATWHVEFLLDRTVGLQRNP